MLVAVDVLGFVGKGAQRWIDLGFISLQPSELMNRLSCSPLRATSKALGRPPGAAVSGHLTDTGTASTLFKTVKVGMDGSSFFAMFPESAP